MKITIEDDDKRLPNGYRKITYGDMMDIDTAEDFTYLFEHLVDRLNSLKEKQKIETNLGVNFVLEGKINTLERLLKKYKDFVELAKDVSVDTL